MGCFRFGIPREFVLWLSDAFDIHQFIETGTNRAESAVWASEHFDNVITVEGYEPLYEAARREYGRISNIEFLLGDSRHHLQRIVPRLSSPAVFWLDAHWCGVETFGQSNECPVLDEIKIINSAPAGHIILIDDARIFLAPPPPPHDPDHWPDICQICATLKDHASDRYVAVHEDVIASVPGSAKAELVSYLRKHGASQLTPPRPEPSLLRRLKKWWTQNRASV